MNGEDDQLIIHAEREPRQGWEQAFFEMSKRCDDSLLDEPFPTCWDEEEWIW